MAQKFSISLQHHIRDGASLNALVVLSDVRDKKNVEVALPGTCHPLYLPSSVLVHLHILQITCVTHLPFIHCFYFLFSIAKHMCGSK